MFIKCGAHVACKYANVDAPLLHHACEVSIARDFDTEHACADLSEARCLPSKRSLSLARSDLFDYKDRSMSYVCIALVFCARHVGDSLNSVYTEGVLAVAV